MSYQDIAKLQIMADEGFSLKLYKCTAGKWSIGAGRNLEDRGITRAEGLFLLDGDLIIAEADAKGLFPNFHELTENRKAVLINMAFNLGQERLAGFKNFRHCIEARNFEAAAAEMLESKWAGQVGPRAQRLAEQMRRG
jgi:lysozyme